jgi:molybdopterin converting factor small subunit
MIAVRIPSALRPFAEGQKDVSLESPSVQDALTQLTGRYPTLRPHLFDETGGLRAYVNLFVNEQDVRGLQGEATPLKPGDRLVIVPSIAGGSDRTLTALRLVDHAALRVNQASIILLLLAAFILDAPWLLGFVGAVMLVGTLVGRPGFLPVYRLVRKLHWVQPEVLPDQSQPHRFAQGVGAAFLGAALAALLAGVPVAGWALGWLVIALAAANLFAGFCVGCTVYYWLQRANVPGFTVAPPAGTLPGRRPQARP